MGQFLCLTRISFIVLLVLSLASAEAEADDAFQLERSRSRDVAETIASMGF
jgi:hypothetical protein